MKQASSWSLFRPSVRLYCIVFAIIFSVQFIKTLLVLIERYSALTQQGLALHSLEPLIDPALWCTVMLGLAVAGFVATRKG